MKNFINALGLIILLLVFPGCDDDSESSGSNRSAVKEASGQWVSIINNGTYYSVMLDMTTAPSRIDVGKEYAEMILKVEPDFEEIIDSYLYEMSSQMDFKTLLASTKNIIPNVPQEFRDEIDGIALALSGKKDSLDDGALSRNEIYMANMLPDVMRPFACSGLSVYGSLSETGSTITARALDWNGGSDSQLCKIQAVITIKNGTKSMCLIGYLGNMGVISAINDDKVFASILDSPTMGTYSSVNKRSYVMDLRYALENETSLDAVAAYMINSPAKYTFNHNIFLSNSSTSKVVEYNFNGYPLLGGNYSPAVRDDTSVLRDDAKWSHKNSICVVNSFVLKDHFNNHNNSMAADLTALNYLRWNNFSVLLAEKGAVVTKDELKQIISYKDPVNSKGDIYVKSNQQLIIVEPGKLLMDVYFRPVKGQSLNPEFVPIQVSF